MSNEHENYWVRKCKTTGCFGQARPLSDYCNRCRIKNKCNSEYFSEIGINLNIKESEDIG